ncbi:MAG: hypothetical protein H6581_27215 [Bacteroidia bacterium]|nr:hypothetical protein [Bacteroidia bacterium]
MEGGNDIFVVSHIRMITKRRFVKCEFVDELTGFEKEIHRLEHWWGFRFDPVSKRMLPQNMANGLPALTTKKYPIIKIK